MGGRIYFLLLFEWWTVELSDFLFFQKYLIQSLIMLCIFVFTMGQLLSVHEHSLSRMHEC